EGAEVRMAEARVGAHDLVSDRRDGPPRGPDGGAHDRPRRRRRPAQGQRLDVRHRHAPRDGVHVHARGAAVDERVPPRDRELDVRRHAQARARDPRQARRRPGDRDRGRAAVHRRPCRARAVDPRLARRRRRLRPRGQRLRRGGRRARARLPVRRCPGRTAAQPGADDHRRPRAVPARRHGRAVHRQRRRAVLPRRGAVGAAERPTRRPAEPDLRRPRPRGVLRCAGDRRRRAHARARDRV
ncbi:MAG: hypothetical protein AVDCRST_MAG67-2425, partial [uncultured Solirubrobacteraceae bacterium]